MGKGGTFDSIRELLAPLPVHSCWIESRGLLRVRNETG